MDSNVIANWLMPLSRKLRTRINIAGQTQKYLPGDPLMERHAQRLRVTEPPLTRYPPPSETTHHVRHVDPRENPRSPVAATKTPAVSRGRHLAEWFNGTIQTRAIQNPRNRRGTRDQKHREMIDRANAPDAGAASA